jgi:hypothetical protein
MLIIDDCRPALKMGSPSSSVQGGSHALVRQTCDQRVSPTRCQTRDHAAPQILWGDGRVGRLHVEEELRHHLDDEVTREGRARSRCDPAKSGASPIAPPMRTCQDGDTICGLFKEQIDRLQREVKECRAALRANQAEFWRTGRVPT